MPEKRVPRDKTGYQSCALPKIQFEEKKLYENAKSLIDAVLRAKPPSSKGNSPKHFDSSR
jgi:ribosomal protein L1